MWQIDCITGTLKANVSFIIIFKKFHVNIFIKKKKSTSNKIIKTQNSKLLIKKIYIIFIIIIYIMLFPVIMKNMFFMFSLKYYVWLSRKLKNKEKLNREYGDGNTNFIKAT